LLAVLTLFIFCTASAAIHAAQKLPVEKAGEIGQPTGQIAFLRNQNVWLMNADGSQPRLISEVLNADGRLSFSPDNRQILFTRAGQVNYQSPDGFGGKHKVYDLFVAYIDSADNGTTHWWRRVSEDLGSRDAEWLADDRVIFCKDLNANIVDAALPNYQICFTDTASSEITVLRKDWQTANEFMTYPSLGPNEQIAFIHFYDLQPQGMAVLSVNDIMISWDSLRVLSKKMPKCMGPAWSPDGKWLAYVGTSMAEPGIFITTPDLKERYLVFEPPPNTYPFSQAPGWSPNSKWLTFATTDGSIWICDIMGNNLKRMTPPGLDRAPVWSKPVKGE
jgi:WD40 repeat protein